MMEPGAPHEPAPASVFDWKPRLPSPLRLILPLAGCVLVLSGFSVLFKVSPPSAQRLPQTTQTVLVLNPQNPASQLALNRAQDRSALILRSDEWRDPQQERSLLPVFQPSFRGFELRLKDLNSSRPQTPLPNYFKPSDLTLPPLPAPAALPAFDPNRQPDSSFTLAVRVQAEAGERAVKSMPQLAELRPRDAPRLRFRVAIAATGRVTLSVPLTYHTDDRDLVPALRAALERMRFVPMPERAVQWADVTFTWQRTRTSGS